MRHVLKQIGTLSWSVWVILIITLGPTTSSALAASSRPYDVPLGAGLQTTHFRTTRVAASASFDDKANNIFYYAGAEAHDDEQGLTGTVVVSALHRDTDQISIIQCSGPDYAHVVSVNAATGSASINVLIDPSAPTCFVSNDVDVSIKVRVYLVGRFDGTYRFSVNTTGTELWDGVTRSYNAKSDAFGETFTGTGGFYTGTFAGEAYSGKRVDRSK